VTLRTVSDLVVIILSSIALPAGRPAFQRWKSDVKQRVHMFSDAELESFLQLRVVMTVRWAWSAIVTSMLFIAAWDLLTQL
jgi:hypothetical protein